MQLNKTDFLHYLQCPQSLWLLKYKPNVYRQVEISLFNKKLIKEGYEVEEVAQLLFPRGVEFPKHTSPALTRQLLKSDDVVFFQPTFITSEDLFARIDILEKLTDETFHIYEVKSSTSIKVEHLQDVCFQKYVMEQNGFTISKVSIIHLNKEYKKQGEINPNELLAISDITEEIEELYPEVVDKIKEAQRFILQQEIDETECFCKYKTRRNHCDNFHYFNGELPDYSIYEISKISAKKINELLGHQISMIADIPLNYNLSPKQKIQFESVLLQEAIIDTRNIEMTLNRLEFPLHFFDYETYPTAIPVVDGLGPHQHLVFQVSIHSMQENGTITHFEWLGEQLEQPAEMLRQMQEFTGMVGTFVCWSSFEKTRNRDMMKWIPTYSEYLAYMNVHMFDLMEIFNLDYVDYRFHGSSSIKNVLPVLCPDLSYEDLEINEGTMALDTWGRMVTDMNFDQDIEETRLSLLAYCKMDTRAMVEIYNVLTNL